jgi:threonine dehydratase
VHQHLPVLLPPASTIADGIAVRQAGQRTLPLCEKYVDEILTVDDEEIAMAILWLLEKEKTLAEGGGAAGMAAMLRHKTTLRGKKVAVILSGGNIDVTMLARIMERGLVKDGRMVRLRITLPDHPGGLEKLTGLIGAERANIVQVTHDRAYFGVHLGETIIDITMETRGPRHVDQLLSKLTAAGYPFERVM